MESIRTFSRLIAAFCLLALVLSCVAAASSEHDGSAEIVWKPKLDSLQVASITLRGIKATTAPASTESCHTICTTCTCGEQEKLNCCARETDSSYSGCVLGKAPLLCATHRPVNTCCRRN